MIFNTAPINFYEFESYKERNFYYKVFAGFLLNEILPGYQSRKEQFIQLLELLTNDKDRCIDAHGKAQSIIQGIAKESWLATFDYHTAQVFAEDKRNDRGEMSDILITSDTYMISIECKFGSNYNIEKDVYSVQERINKFSTKYHLIPLQVLLLKKSKWGYSAKISGRLSEEFSGKSCPIVILFWEDIMGIVDIEQVKNYMEQQLNRKFR